MLHWVCTEEEIGETPTWRGEKQEEGERAYKIMKNASWAATHFHQVKNNIKKQISPPFVILFPLKYTVTKNSGQVSHSSILPCCQHTSMTPPLRASKANPNRSFTALTAALPLRTEDKGWRSLPWQEADLARSSSPIHLTGRRQSPSLPVKLAGTQWAAVHGGCQPWHLAWGKT